MIKFPYVKELILNDERNRERYLRGQCHLTKPDWGKYIITIPFCFNFHYRKSWKARRYDIPQSYSSLGTLISECWLGQGINVILYSSVECMTFVVNIHYPSYPEYEI